MTRARSLGFCGLVPAIALSALLGPSAPVRADDALSRELSEVAQKVKQLLDGRNEDAIAIGQFSGPAQLEATAGPAIVKALTDELKKVGIEVKRRSELSIKGEYRDLKDSKLDEIVALLKAKVEDRAGVVVVELERRVSDKAILAALFGLTVSLDKPATAEKVTEQIESSLDEPKVAITVAPSPAGGGAGPPLPPGDDGGMKKTRVSASADSPFAIEVQVKAGGRYEAREAKDEDGMAFVSIDKGEIYAIRLINDAAHDVAAVLTIDGLNVFSFSENTEYSHWIVPAKGELLVKGWHRNNRVSNEFLIAEYAKSAAAELNTTAQVGTITACFSAAWPEGGKPPADEEPPRSKGIGGNATAKGQEVSAVFDEVKRHVGRLRAAVSLRYLKD